MSNENMYDMGNKIDVERYMDKVQEELVNPTVKVMKDKIKSKVTTGQYLPTADGKFHWGNMDIASLLKHLKSEVQELEDEINRPEVCKQEVLKEASDVCNLAMMIFHNYNNNIEK
jgi:NTP pyrophosphatase (non-canonical NTP hydrolase)